MMKSSLLFSLLVIVSQLCPAQDKGPAVAIDSPAGASAAAGISDPAYVIGPSDVLTITVWKDSTLSGERLVRPDGKISMPLLGDIQGAGSKPMDLAAQIGEKLKKFMKDPQVSVVVSQIHHQFVYLLGEVGKRGPVEMPPGMTFLEAISSGGGLTDYAKKSKIYILRTVNGKQEKIRVDYKKALNGQSGFNIVLTPGDTIVVP